MKRRLDIDFIRGLAVILMIIFHIGYDLNFLKLYNLNLSTGFWRFLQVLTASLFLLVVGISLSLRKNTFKSHFRGFLKIFKYAFLITLITYIFFPNNYIFFGILHLIAISILLGYFFINLKYLNLILGTFLIIIGVHINHIMTNNFFIHLLGFKQLIPTFDFYPILPWFGIVLIGIFIGKTILRKEIKLKIKWLSFLGRHSLLIYFIHQPILIILLRLLFFRI